MGKKEVSLESAAACPIFQLRKNHTISLTLPANPIDDCQKC